MRKKLISLFILLTIMFISSNFDVFASEKGKTIVISMNKTNIEDMQEIPILNEKLSKSGYIGLMNVRGDGGNDDKRAYATIGSGSRAYISTSVYKDFTKLNEDNSIVYNSIVGEKPKLINNLTINTLLSNNNSKGQYGAVLGNLGQKLTDNNISISVLGNADEGDDPSTFNRNIGLIAMDSLGRIDNGNVDNINIKDNSMPFGIRTDYSKLVDETKRLYNTTDVIFIELGDTSRLNSFKSNLNEKTYPIMKSAIYKNVDNYLREVFDMINSEDIVYVVSPTVSSLDYNNKKRLSPIIKFDGDKKGLLYSATTRREGIVANVDISADILNKYHIENDFGVGKKFKYKELDNNLEYLTKDFNKIVSINNIRGITVSIFVGIIAVSWIIGMIALFFKEKIPLKNKKVLFILLKEFIKLGLVMPLAFLIAPISNASTNFGIVFSIIVSVIVLYIIAHLLFKNNDLKQMAFYSLATISIITIDSIFGTYLIKNNIMSYDVMIGARYYGIGNEYEGVTIASIILGLSILLHYNKNISKLLLSVLMMFVLIASAHPAMGANVGGAISESVAYLVFILLVLDRKINIKMVLIIIGITLSVVFGFAFMDIISGTESHLSLFVNQILTNGSIAIIQTFGRKIAMNIKLAQTSIWVNILLAGICIISILILKPEKYFKNIYEVNPLIFKGFVASIIGCFVTLLVNDSGIVSASTASIYILVPIIIILINRIIYNKNE